MGFSNGYDWQFYSRELGKCETLAETWALLFIVCKECKYELKFNNIEQQAKYLRNNGWPQLGDFIMTGLTKIRGM